MGGMLDNGCLRQVIDSLEVGVLLLDRARCIVHSNRWLSARSGQDAASMAGRPFVEIFPETAGGRLEQAIEHALHDRLPSLLSPALHGTLLPLYQTADDRRRARRMQQMIHVLPLDDDSPASCLIQISDMTANISRERLLRQQTETLRRTTTTDPLTGLANRRRFDETLAAEFRKARTAARPLGLMIVDVDFFNTYNALYGRDQGDARLAEVAAVLRDAIRPAGDLAARYGGDEFALILPGARKEDVCQLAENLRLRIATLKLPHAGSQVADHLTVSVGTTAMLPEGESDTHTLLSSADVALYQAKHDGRNRAIYFSPEDGSFKLCG